MGKLTKLAKDCGSVTLFCRPDCVLPREPKEVVYHMLPMSEIITGLKTSQTIFSGMMDWLHERVNRFISWVRNGDVKISLHVGKISSTNNALIQVI